MQITEFNPDTNDLTLIHREFNTKGRVIIMENKLFIIRDHYKQASWQEYLIRTKGSSASVEDLSRDEIVNYLMVLEYDFENGLIKSYDDKDINKFESANYLYYGTQQVEAISMLITLAKQRNIDKSNIDNVYRQIRDSGFNIDGYKIVYKKEKISGDYSGIMIYSGDVETGRERVTLHTFLFPEG